MKKLGIIVCLLCASLAMFSQVSEQQLQGKQWLAEEGFWASDVIDFFMQFDNQKMTFTFREKGKDKVCASYTYSYYLSPTKETSFDVTKVGKDQKGNYIVLNREYVLGDKTKTNFLVYEILGVSDSNLRINAQGIKISLIVTDH